MIIGNATGEPASEPPVDTATPPARQRSWTMPASPITRQQVDEAGRLAVKAGAGLTAGAKAVLRAGVRAVKRSWLAFDALPPLLRLLAVLGVLTLVGIVGSVALTGTRQLFCAVVVVPVCSIALGALGHRWAGRNDDHQATEPTELARSVAYVDKKLAVALEAFGSERHQQAVLALVQAKTAAELALGSEGDSLPQIGAPAAVDDQRLRPRIRTGSALAAS